MQNRKPFIGLEVYLRSTGKQSPKYEYMGGEKTLFKDTFTKKKYSTYQFEQWLQEPHVIQKIRDGASLRLGSVDVDNENPSKYDDSSTQRKFVFFFMDAKSPSKQIDGVKPIGQTIQRPIQQMKPQHQASPAHELDDDLPDF